MMKCYGYHSGMQIDLDTVIVYVKRSGGHFAVKADTVLLWVPESAEAMLTCAWPDLEPIPYQDLI